MKTLLKYLLVLSTILLSNAYCINTNNMAVQIAEKDSSNFNTEYLQDIVQNSNNISHNNVNNEYYVLDEQNLQKITFSKQQLSHTINAIFTNTYNKIMSINNINPNDLKLKLQTAEPFYRIIYNPQKLKFILFDNDLNIFNTISNIVNEIKPLCEEYAIANLGPKSILYGIETLEGILPTINTQFINGLNFQVDLTKTRFRDVDDFTKYYIEMFATAPTLRNCIDSSLLEKLINQTDCYIHNTIKQIEYWLNNYNPKYLLSNNTNNNIIGIICKKISIIHKLRDFLNLNKQYITKNLEQIMINRFNIFAELSSTQYEEININELLNNFFYKLENINNLPESEKQDLLTAFFRNTIKFEYVQKLILSLNNIEIINKLNYYLNRNDIKQFGIRNIFADFENKMWNEAINDCEGCNIEEKLEEYYKNWLMFCNDHIHISINPSIERIKNNKNNNIKELKNTMLEYLVKMKNYLLNETNKYATIMKNKQSLVPNNFWKQKQINFKNY